MDAIIQIFGEDINGFWTDPKVNITNNIIWMRSLKFKMKTHKQIVIHRSEELMHYAYILKFSDKEYIGFCITLEGKMFINIRMLFSLIEGLIADLAQKEHGFLRLNADNKIIGAHRHVSMAERYYINNYFKSIQRELYLMTAELPVSDRSVVVSSRGEFLIEDKKEDIIKSSYMNSYTAVYYDSSFAQKPENSRGSATSPSPIFAENDNGFSWNLIITLLMLAAFLFMVVLSRA